MQPVTPPLTDFGSQKPNTVYLPGQGRPFRHSQCPDQPWTDVELRQGSTQETCCRLYDLSEVGGMNNCVTKLMNVIVVCPMGRDLEACG